jgi:hypothetical protein
MVLCESKSSFLSKTINSAFNYHKAEDRLLKISNQKISFFPSLNQYFPHIPNVASKKPSDLFYGEICSTKLSIPHADLEFVWNVHFRLKIYKLRVPIGIGIGIGTL